MNRTMHTGASQDVIHAVYFYTQTAGPHIAARFLNEFERVARLLIDNPGFGTPAPNGRRIYPLHSFPYSIVYTTKGDNLLILILRHHRQKPNYASRRH